MRLSATFIAVLAVAGCDGRQQQATSPLVQRPAPRMELTYPLHRGITATVFWVGEPPSSNSPSNAASAWDERWEEHFGGFDDPKHRVGFGPAGFLPRENPFYVALPYNDMPSGRRRADAASVIPWAATRPFGPRESMCKNRWVCIQRAGRTCYGQWEDVGPFTSNDAAYVFGGAAPRNQKNRSAGIDVSSAIRDYLKLGGMGQVDWRFVDQTQVPSGPWKLVITR